MLGKERKTASYLHQFLDIAREPLLSQLPCRLSIARHHPPIFAQLTRLGMVSISEAGESHNAILNMHNSTATLSRPTAPDTKTHSETGFHITQDGSWTAGKI